MTGLDEILIRCGAARASEIRIEDCRVSREYQLRRLGFDVRTAVIGVIPYYTHFCDGEREISVYAMARDYHLYIKQMSDEVIRAAQTAYPEGHFALVGDSSPIDEVDAAARAGLGIIGKNHLLITPDFSSFIFIFEMLTDIPTDAEAKEPQYCEMCGACERACPTCLRGLGDCLSAITQKKGELNENEQNLMRKYHTMWGCDICQLACPHTKKALRTGTIYTDAEWFNTAVTPTVTPEMLEDDEEFRRRAYSWRGKAVVERNIKILHPEERGN